VHETVEIMSREQRYAVHRYRGNILEGNDMIAWLHIGNTLTDGLDDTCTLMTEYDGEGAFGVLAGQRICV
jgi:hypothetical protein